MQHFAFAHDRDPVGQGHRFDLIVGDVEHRDAEFSREVFDFVAHFLAQPGVEIAERLVHEQHFRLDGEGARQGDPLLLAAA